MCMPGSQTTRWYGSSRYSIRPCCLLLPRRHRHPGLHCFRRSQPGLHTPLSTLRLASRGATRMTRGRCGSLPLHRNGLSPSTFLPVSRRTAAQWLAYTSPCRRFADILADACARLGADVGRYSFIAVDLHHLLLAGLPAHLCENAQEPTRRRIIFSIALSPIAATALFLFRLTESRRIFYAQIETLCFHATSPHLRHSPTGS